VRRATKTTLISRHASNRYQQISTWKGFRLAANILNYFCQNFYCLPPSILLRISRWYYLLSHS
jgi:hypothetical protein